MITWLILSIILITTALPFLKTPIKIMRFMVAARLIVFISAWYNAATSWLPLIYFLIFTGGITLLFIMVSSILPNEKSRKSSLFLTLGAASIVAPLILLRNLNINFITLKWRLQSYFEIIFLCIIIGAYFFMFIYILGTKGASINRKVCFKSWIL